MTPAPVNITVLPTKTYIQVIELDENDKPVGRPTDLWGGQTKQVHIQAGKKYIVQLKPGQL